MVKRQFFWIKGEKWENVPFFYAIKTSYSPTRRRPAPFQCHSTSNSPDGFSRIAQYAPETAVCRSQILPMGFTARTQWLFPPVFCFFLTLFLSLSRFFVPLNYCRHGDKQGMPVSFSDFAFFCCSFGWVSPVLFSDRWASVPL